jgi:hypothetical protein
MKVLNFFLSKDSNIDRKDIGNFSLLFGSLLLLFSTSLVVLASANLVIKFPLTAWIILISILISLSITYWGIKIYFVKNRFIVFSTIVILGISVFIFFLKLSGNYYDFSWDGQTIHQGAIILLSNGWNPYTDILAATDNVEFIGLNHFSRGGWYPAAAIYKATGHIEQSKVFNFTSILITFSFCFAALLKLKNVNYISAFLISILLALNPISICQSLTFYIDGQLASALISLAAVSLIIFYGSDKFLSIVYGALVIILFNIKFTGVIYAVIFAGGLGLFLLFYKKKIEFYSHLKTSVFYSIFAFFVVGASPYVVNTIHYGHPFYPVLGQKDNAANRLISTIAMPANFEGMDRMEMLWYSIFSRSVWSRAPENAHLKIPFTTSPEEIQHFHRADVEMSAMGAYFSGILLISIILLLIAFIKIPREALVALVVIVIIASSIFINPVCWMGRYVPQLWAIPLVIVILFNNQKLLWYKIISFTLSLIIAVNIYLIMKSNYSFNSLQTEALKNEFQQMKASGKTIPIYFGGFQSNKVKFQELGIPYQEVNSVEELNTPSPYCIIRSVCIKKDY